MIPYTRIKDAYGKKYIKAATTHEPDTKISKKSKVADLMQSLPIASSGEGGGNDEDQRNFYPSDPVYKAPQHNDYLFPPNEIEGFTSFASLQQHQQAHPSQLKQYYQPTNADTSISNKLDYCIQLMEQQHFGVEEANSMDIILYTSTGIFLLFALDIMCNISRKIKRF